MLALTFDGRILLVKQYRPALDKITLELLGGLLEKGEQPDMSAARELREETGFEAPNKLEFFGCLAPDTGRLENRLWCYFARNVVPVDSITHQPDPGVELVINSVAELRDAINDGSFDHAQHIAIIGLGLLKGYSHAGEFMRRERIFQPNEPV